MRLPWMVRPTSVGLALELPSRRPALALESRQPQPAAAAGQGLAGLGAGQRGAVGAGGDGAADRAVEPMVVAGAGPQLPFVHFPAAAGGADEELRGEVVGEHPVAGRVAAEQRQAARVAQGHRQAGVDERLPEVGVVEDVALGLDGDGPTVAPRAATVIRGTQYITRVTRTPGVGCVVAEHRRGESLREGSRRGEAPQAAGGRPGCSAEVGGPVGVEGGAFRRPTSAAPPGLGTRRITPTGD